VYSKVKERFAFHDFVLSGLLVQNDFWDNPEILLESRKNVQKERKTFVTDIFKLLYFVYLKNDKCHTLQIELQCLYAVLNQPSQMLIFYVDFSQNSTLPMYIK
jgi:hypothetical protein